MLALAELVCEDRFIKFRAQEDSSDSPPISAHMCGSGLSIDVNDQGSESVAESHDHGLDVSIVGHDLTMYDTGGNYDKVPCLCRCRFHRFVSVLDDQ